MFLCLVTAVAGRTTVAGKVDDETVLRSVGRNLDPSSVDSKRVNCQDGELVVHIDEQSQGIACVVHVGKKYFDVGAGDECRASSSAGGFKCEYQGVPGDDRRRGGASGSGNRPRWSCIQEARRGATQGIRRTRTTRAGSTRLELERSNGVFELMLEQFGSLMDNSAKTQQPK